MSYRKSYSNKIEDTLEIEIVLEEDSGMAFKITDQLEIRSPNPEMAKYNGWTRDPLLALEYLTKKCKLRSDDYCGFYFEDGTGFAGTSLEFIPYLIRRFRVFPNDSFEIDRLELSECDKSARVSGELYLPEPGPWNSNKRDPRF